MIPIDDCDLQEMPPTWAIGRAEGLEIGAHLPTKDGRRLGNAHVVDEFTLQYKGNDYNGFAVLTDAGRVLHLTSEEAEELFHPPEWVAEVTEVVALFDRLGLLKQEPTSNKELK